MLIMMWDYATGQSWTLSKIPINHFATCTQETGRISHALAFAAMSQSCVIDVWCVMGGLLEIEQIQAYVGVGVKDSGCWGLHDARFVMYLIPVGCYVCLVMMIGG